ncbi:MAG: ferritin-like domain-containing protein [Candidatus Latescibacterota bacterium]
MEQNTLHDLFAEQLGDLHSAEVQLLEALPKMAGAAASRELKEAIERHVNETRGQVTRLDQIYTDVLHQRPGHQTSEAMEGLIRQGQEVLHSGGDPEVKDAAIIAVAQHIEHYEISAYGTARALAGKLGYDDAQELLSDTLDEESQAGERLTCLAMGGISAEGMGETEARGSGSRQ